jgi:alginate O-acetyltransferase complex protein AlgI
MIFNSFVFAVFLPIVLFSAFLFKKNKKNILLLASYFFYGWWNWSYLLLIFFSTIIDFICAKKIVSSKQYRKKYLYLSLAVNLGVLFSFKYFNFFNNQVNLLLETLNVSYLIPHMGIILPMGISFYTFQTMAYTIDVYKGKIQPEKNFFTFALFVTYFPQLVAGPIERAKHLLSEINKNSSITVENIYSGLGRVLFGLFKKVVIADRLALFVNQVYQSPEEYDGSILLIATVFFAFQIYCDFSGYSDIAIGVSRMFGIRLMENFNIPYLANGISDFWSKWHISLSTWFRDYVYIPLGGNQSNHLRNIFLVFLISGLWHGASWTFIIWGALHGAAFIVSYLIINPLVKKYLKKCFLWKRISQMFTFSFICITWIFFRADTINDALFIISSLPHFNIQDLNDFAYLIKVSLLDPTNLNNPLNIEYGKIFFQMTIFDFIISPILIFGLILTEKWKSKNSINGIVRFFIYAFLIISIMLLGVFSKSQFIYFQF